MSLTFVKQVYNGTIFSSYHFSDPYLRVISRQILVLVPQNQSKYFNTALNILPLKTNIKEILQKVCIVWIIRVNYVGTDFVQILIVSFIWDRFRHRFEFIFQFPEYFKCLGFYLRQNNLTTVGFSLCQQNMIKRFQIEEIIVQITKMTWNFSSDKLNGRKWLSKKANFLEILVTKVGQFWCYKKLKKTK